MPLRRTLIERRFETVLWKLRLIAILPVIMSLLGGIVVFVCGTLEILRAMGLMIDGSTQTSKALNHLLGQLVGGIDLYLIGIALLIFGYGVYELIISDIDAANKSGGGSGLLDIRSLDALKEKLVKVIVVALIVSAFKAMLKFPIDSANNLLVFSGSVLLLALSAYLVASSPKHPSS